MLDTFIKFHAFWLLGHRFKELFSVFVALIDGQRSRTLAPVVLLQILLVLVALALLTGDNSLWMNAWGRSGIVITDITIIALCI